ncbi:hypothetical protein C8R45DRAFT_1174532, partial [Mycena sanguinolenta]
DASFRKAHKNVCLFSRAADRTELESQISVSNSLSMAKDFIQGFLRQAEKKCAHRNDSTNGIQPRSLPNSRPYLHSSCTAPDTVLVSFTAVVPALTLRPYSGLDASSTPPSTLAGIARTPEVHTRNKATRRIYRTAVPLPSRHPCLQSSAHVHKDRGGLAALSTCWAFADVVPLGRRIPYMRQISTMNVSHLSSQSQNRAPHRAAAATAHSLVLDARWIEEHDVRARDRTRTGRGDERTRDADGNEGRGSSCVYDREKGIPT